MRQRSLLKNLLVATNTLTKPRGVNISIKKECIALIDLVILFAAPLGLMAIVGLAAVINSILEDFDL